MRQPPSPLLLSARKRRPRRTPPHGAFGRASIEPSSQADPAAPDAANDSDAERCVLVQPFPDSAQTSSGDDSAADRDTPDK